MLFFQPLLLKTTNTEKKEFLGKPYELLQKRAVKLKDRNIWQVHII